MKDIRSVPKGQVVSIIKEMGQPEYRATQLFNWVHQRQVNSFDDMSNLPRVLKERLADEYEFKLPTIQTKLVSKIDGTVKYLFCLADGETVECVVMRYKHGLSICISTQVGCKMGCTFCASTIDLASSDLKERIGNVVLMGIGEPLDNLEQVTNFIDIITDPQGVNLSKRHISLSTCGIVPGILALAETEFEGNLCISLHAPNNTLRSKLMPINRRYPIEQVIDACKVYQKKGGRRITLEYTLIDHQNDTEQCAMQLCQLCKKLFCHVNLIPVNAVKETGYHKSSKDNIQRFLKILEANHVNVTLRRTLGQDISAACGQLRRKEMSNS